VHDPCYFGPARASDIIVLDTPRGDLIEVSSSSYGLSLSLNTGSHPDEGIEAVPGGSSSLSIGELWPGIDQLDEVGPEGTSMIPVQDPLRDQVSHCCVHPRGSRRMGGGSSRVD
jgi:hypothetical protein